MISSAVALVVATSVHAGFQATVTTLVYPALARVPPGDWERAHLAHTRAITPLVAVIYVGLAVTGGWALLSDPDCWTLVAVAGLAAAVLVTAVIAAPAHGRLGEGHDRARIERLLRADRLRAVAAVIAAAAAIAATW